jgi:cytochrome c oxidase subunit 3
MTTHAATMDSHDEAMHEASLSRGMWGMVLFIGSEIMLFAGLFAAYFFVRNQAAGWPPATIDPEHVPSKWLATGLAAILISSGLLGHMGIIAMRDGFYGIEAFGRRLGVTINRRLGLMLGMSLAIVLGGIFIGIQAWEWLSLMDEGLTAKSGVYGSTFYALTGFHGAHVIAGLAMLIVVLVRATWRDFTPGRHLFADAAMMYWHFVDFVWVLLVIVVYWTGT